MSEIPDPGEFAGYILGTDGLRIRGTYTKMPLVSDPRLIACWAQAAWTDGANNAKAEKHKRYCLQNAALCLRIAQKGE